MEKGSLQQIAVVGAGLVGCAAALALSNEGHRVTVFDPAEPGSGTSSGNAGGIVTSAVVPTATPGIWRNLPGYVLDPMSPILLRWRHGLRAAPWLLRFLASARLPEVERISRELAPLLRPAFTAHQEMAALAGVPEMVVSDGWLKVFGSEESFSGTALDRRLMEAAGVPYEILGPDALRDRLPNVAPAELTRGIWHPGCGHVRNPRGLAAAWMRAAQSRGALHSREQVRRIQPRQGGVTLMTTSGPQAFDLVVIAAGAWSGELLRQMGEKVLLDTERGYHLGFAPETEALLPGPVFFADRKFVLTPMAEGLRLTSGVELAGLTAPPRYDRIRKLLPRAQEVMPALAAQEVRREWMGYRPSPPDSKPVIGLSARHPAVIHAFGHGHLGLTMSAITGQLVADLAAGREPRVALSAFSAARFG